MAVFDQMIFPKSSCDEERSGSPMRTREVNSRQQAHQQTPMPAVDSGRPPRSSKLSILTPCNAATPDTVALTPETNDSFASSPIGHSLLHSDVPKHWICAIQQPVSNHHDGSTSSTSSTTHSWLHEDDSDKSSTPQNSSVEPIDPSPSGGGRTLFHLDEDCETNSSFEEDGEDFYLRQSPPPPATKRRDPHHGGKWDTKSEGSRHRSRRQSSFENKSKNAKTSSRRRHGTARSRSMGEGNEFQLTVNAVPRNTPREQASSDDEDEFGNFRVQNDSSESPYRPVASGQRQNVSRRRSSLAARASDTNDPPVWYKVIPRRISCMVWLLCIVGITSMGMVIVLHNANNDLVRMEQQDPIAVLFRRNAHTASTSPLRGIHAQTQDAAAPGTLERSLDKVHHHPIDLHHLAQGSVDSRSSRKKADAAKKRKKEKEEQAKKKHEPKTDLNGKKKSSVQEKEKEKRPKDESKSHRHHLSEHEGPHREYVRAKPTPFGISNIPMVALPSPLDLESEQLKFDNVDRNLYEGKSVTSNARIVVLDGSRTEDWKPLQRKIELYPADFTDNTQLYSVLDSSDGPVSSTMEMREPYSTSECVPMQEWQTTFNPSCNGMHEVDMPGMGDRRTEDDVKLFGMKGFWRNAWRYDSIGGHRSANERDTVVLKTLKINHRFEDAFYEHNRIDAVVLERLTASPHVINVFGFCGNSVLTEYADGKRLGELADKMTKVPLARLNIARDIASGLADVHGIDGDGNATFVHLDINPANVVSIGGTLKLNDFNIGVLRRWNVTSNQPCGIPSQYPNPQWRSPEEARQEKTLTEKVDVFSLGHIFFRLICGHEPWHKLEPGGMPTKEELNEKVKKGKLPTIPDSILKSTDPEIVAIREAMLRCYTYDPMKRPSAREIAASLSKALNKLEEVTVKR